MASSGGSWKGGSFKAKGGLSGEQRSVFNVVRTASAEQTVSLGFGRSEKTRGTITPESIARESGLSMVNASSALATLELRGLVKRLPGNVYQSVN